CESGRGFGLPVVAGFDRDGRAVDPDPVDGQVAVGQVHEVDVDVGGRRLDAACGPVTRRQFDVEVVDAQSPQAVDDDGADLEVAAGAAAGLIEHIDAERLEFVFDDQRADSEDDGDGDEADEPDTRTAAVEHRIGVRVAMTRVGRGRAAMTGQLRYNSLIPGVRGPAINPRPPDPERRNHWR